MIVRSEEMICYGRKEQYVMKEIRYSKEIADAVRNFLEEDGWNFHFNEKNGIFQFDLSIGGKIKRISYLIRVREDDYLVYALSPVGADADSHEELIRMTEFICHVNYGLCNGNFELNMNNGEIRYKTYVNCGDMIPEETVVRESIYCCAIMFDQYASGIMRVIFENASAREAVEECEKTDELFRYLLKGKEEDNEKIKESIPEVISALLQ